MGLELGKRFKSIGGEDDGGEEPGSSCVPKSSVLKV